MECWSSAFAWANPARFSSSPKPSSGQRATSGAMMRSAAPLREALGYVGLDARQLDHMDRRGGQLTGELLQLPAPEQQMLPLVHHGAEREQRGIPGIDSDDVARLEEPVQTLPGLAWHRGQSDGFRPHLEYNQAGVARRQGPKRAQQSGLSMALEPGPAICVVGPDQALEQRRVALRSAAPPADSRTAGPGSRGSGSAR